MGQVYGRMSVPGAVGLYSARWSAGDHHASCPSKAKPGLNGTGNNKFSSMNASGGARRRRRSLSVDSNDSASNERLGVRLTRNAARQLALQQAAQQAASIRRSARLAGSSGGLRGGRSSNASGGAAATLPSTLRRSARIAGFRYIGHRMAANFSSSLSAGGRLRRIDPSTGPSAASAARSASVPSAQSRAPSMSASEPRRSIRLMRAA